MVYHRAFDIVRTQTLHRLQNIHDLSVVERHLLVQDNAALGLDPQSPTVTPTIDQTQQRKLMQLSGPTNKDYADVLMPQLYETEHILAVISDPDVQPRDNTRLA